MPRRDITFSYGCYYHIYNRGARRQSIFRCDENYRYLLRLMKKVAGECVLTIIAYCLLPNHYHWLIRQDGDIAASALPKRVFGSYTQAFNNAYGLSGALFEDRYEAILVATDDYRRNLCCYIHANPVRHGIALSPDLWPYSNYLEWINAREGTLVDQTFVKTHFPEAGSYQHFVLEYLQNRTQLPKGLIAYLQNLEG